jgi:hypothetical protein
MTDIVPGNRTLSRQNAWTCSPFFSRLLGEDHPLTLTTARNLAGDLRELGQIQAARELDEDTFARMRRVLGDDHPETLKSANNLALDLRELDEA